MKRSACELSLVYCRLSSDVTSQRKYNCTYGNLMQICVEIFMRAQVEKEVNAPLDSSNKVKIGRNYLKGVAGLLLGNIATETCY